MYNVYAAALLVLSLGSVWVPSLVKIKMCQPTSRSQLSLSFGEDRFIFNGDLGIHGLMTRSEQQLRTQNLPCLSPVYRTPPCSLFRSATVGTDVRAPGGGSADEARPFRCRAGVAGGDGRGRGGQDRSLGGGAGPQCSHVAYWRRLGSVSRGRHSFFFFEVRMVLCCGCFCDARSNRLFIRSLFIFIYCVAANANPTVCFCHFYLETR